MIEDCGCRILAIEIEVGMLGQIERGGRTGGGLHIDAQLIG